MKVKLEFVIDEIEEWHRNNPEPSCADGSCTCFHIIDMLKETYGLE